MKRKPTPQPEFGITVEAFNLFSETSEDGARLAAEAAASSEAKAAAASAQQTLFTQSSDDN